jgi:uncharacterized protein (TIGR00255 family)
MTGYGRGSASLGPQQVIVDVRTVNHRFLDLRMHVAHELANQSALVEECVRKEALRGRVDVSVRLEGAAATEVALDRGRAHAAFIALRDLRDELAPNEAVPLSLMSNVPGLFVETTGPNDDERSRATQLATEQACRQLEAMRRAEGARLARDLSARCARIVSELASLESAVPALVAQQRQKLLARIAQLLPSALPLDHGRLEHEVALLADRADVSEEITRLRAHAAAVDQILTAADDEAVGHRIDFLLQEMSREANTASAKLPDAQATQTMLEIKAELLRMREQVQNIL